MVITKMNKKGIAGVVFLVISLLVVSSGLIITVNKFQKTYEDNNIAETGFLLSNSVGSSFSLDGLDENEADDDFVNSFSGGGGGSSGKKSKKVDNSDALIEEINLDKNEEFMDVIVMLKDDETTTITKESLSEIKTEVKIKQNKVLSKLNSDEFHIKHKYNTISGFAGKVTKKGLDKLKQDPNVEAIYEDELLHITLAESVPLINADDVWSEGITGEGSVVCVLDTGVDYTHPDLGNPSCNITINGNVESYLLESAHPYPNNYNNTWTITKSGFNQIAVHFEMIGLEKQNYDYIEILDSNDNVVQTIKSDLVWDPLYNHCENMSDIWSVSVPGDTIGIRLVSDSDYTCFGFKINQVLNGTNNYWNNCGRILDGYDFINDDYDPMDDHGHGTHVAGIVAANGSIKGVAPDAKLVAVKVCDKRGSCSSSAMIAGIDWCNSKKNAYNIVATTMSIGDEEEYNSTTCPTSGIDNAINEAHSLGIAVTVASGNNASSTGISYPACSPNAISVGSTTKADVISNFTNTGDLLDVLAPGSSIYSTILNGNYGYKWGTSMATPHVAGAIALLKQFSPLASPDQVRDALKNTGILITDPDNSLIFPRIDILAAAMSLIECSSNIECGIDGYIGNSFCQKGSVWQDYTTYTCSSHGTCSSLSAPELIENCTYGCLEGACIYSDLPDLNVTDLVIQSITEKTITLAFTIKNIGDAIADQVYWMIDTNSSDKNPERTISSTLNPGEWTRAYMMWDYSQSGNYTPTVIVDFNNSINESDEENNEASIEVSV